LIFARRLVAVAVASASSPPSTPIYFWVVAMLAWRAGKVADLQAAHWEDLLGRLGKALGLADDWSVTSIKEEDGACP
jgi:hypothetical protein